MRIQPSVKYHKTDYDVKMKYTYLFLLLGLLPFLLVVSSQDIHGLIEIKKYKVINSEAVCGDKLCSPLDEQKAKKGTSTRDIKICGDRPCNVKNAMPSQPVSKTDSLLKIDSFSINERNFLLFKGKGWHNLHNVEIKIVGHTFETSVRSQTDSDGNLYMPWPVPKSFADGMYSIFATDGIRNIEISVEIKTNGNVSVSTTKTDKCTSTKVPIDWSGCDLYGRILTNVDLRMAKLKNANLFGAILKNKDLSGADLTNANLKKANLDGALLIGADLSHSNIIDAKVRGADLSNAKMTFAKLYRTDFTGSKLTNVDFTSATLTYSNLSFTDLKDANLENAGTWGANLNHCKNHPICEN